MKKAVLCILGATFTLLLLSALYENASRSKMAFNNDANAAESPAAMDVGTSKHGSTEIEVPDNFVLIKGDSFKMGSPDSEAWRGDDETGHLVTVSDFYMSIHEVTQNEY